MAKNLATYVKSISPAGASRGPSEVVCKANIWEMYGTGWLGNSRGYGAEMCSYCRTCGIWCVPNVTIHPNNGGEAIADGAPNKAKFEIWGPGGKASGNQNCGISAPSGAGAYAYKTIDVTAGSCYYVHVGYAWCCHPPTGGSDVVRSTECRNLASFNTSVTGTGLTNFCADQGRGSTFLCCNFNATAFDSDGVKYWSVDSHYGTGAEAKYYGADGGATGKLGWFEKKPGAPADNPLSYVQWVPYPGGNIDTKGGHLLYPMVGMGHAGNICCTHEYLRCNMNAMYGFGSSKMPTHYTFGQGSPGYHMCAGDIGCADPNSPGRVKITFWRE